MTKVFCEEGKKDKHKGKTERNHSKVVQYLCEVSVSAGSIKRVYDIIHQPPVQPNKYKYLLPKYDIQLEGKNNPVYPTPVRIPATGNVLHCANGMQKSLVATRHIENLNIPASSSPRVPNSNLVNSTDTKGAKHSNISTQKCPQNQNIEKVNVAAPTSSSKLPQEKSIIGLYKIEKTSSNINKATQQSPELQNKEQIKVVPIMTTGKILNKPVPVNSEEKEKKTNAVAVKSPVVPNSQQIKIVSTSTDKQVLNGNKANAQQIPAVPTTEQVKLVPTPTSTTQPTINKSDSSKGNTTYSFKLEAVKGCLRVSDQNCSKILTNTLQDPTNIGHIKTLDIQSTNNNKTTPQAPSLCPNSEHVNRLNIPLSISPATAPGKFVKLHDNKGIVFPFVHHPTSVKIIIDWSTTTKTNDLAPDLFSIAVTLSKGIYKQISLSMWRHPKIRSSLINFLLDTIERQGCAVCGHGRKEKIKVPIKCDYCDMTFRSMAKAKCHTYTHTGEKPFKCDQCTKRFARTDGLKSHIQNRHKKKKDVIESLVKSSMAEIYSGIQKGSEESKSTTGSHDDYVAPVDQDGPTDVCGPVEGQGKAVKQVAESKDTRKNNDEKHLQKS